MPTRDQIIEESATANLSEFMEHGPGLRWSTRSWAVAKDTANNRVKLGGLGCMGVGEMWFDLDVVPHYTEDPTFADAPEQDSTGGFGVYE